MKKTTLHFLMFVGVFILLLSGSIIYELGKKSNNSLLFIPQPEVIKEEIVTMITVQIDGAVNFPGVYEVPSTMHVYELIDFAQPYVDAVFSKINLSAKLVDGQKITVAGKIVPKISKTVSRQAKLTYLIDLNQADLDELMKLPGIGPASAQKIIDYRKENGKFEVIEDLLKVSGIGEKKFLDLKPLVKVGW